MVWTLDWVTLQSLTSSASCFAVRDQAALHPMPNSILLITMLLILPTFQTPIGQHTTLHCIAARAQSGGGGSGGDDVSGQTDSKWLVFVGKLR